MGENENNNQENGAAGADRQNNQSFDVNGGNGPDMQGYDTNGSYGPNMQGYDANGSYGQNGQMYGYPQGYDTNSGYGQNNQGYGINGGYGQNNQGYGANTGYAGNWQQMPGMTPEGTKNNSGNKTGNKKYILIGAVAVAALVLAVVLFRCLFARGERSIASLVKTVTEAVEDENGRKYYNLYDKKYIKSVLKDVDEKKSEWIEDCEDGFEDFEDYLEDSIGIGKVKKMKSEVTYIYKYKGDELKDIKEQLKDDYGIKITSFAKVEFKWEINGKKDDYEMYSSCYVYKRGSRWYLYEMN